MSKEMKHVTPVLIAGVVSVVATVASNLAGFKVTFIETAVPVFLAVIVSQLAMILAEVEKRNSSKSE